MTILVYNYYTLKKGDDTMKLKQKKLLNYILVGVMAAMIFVTTSFLKIPISTPAGQTMLKVSNILILLAGMLFGGVYGGLASGIGSGLYDLFDPVYISSAPLTFIRFFLMSLICGLISNSGNSKGTSFKRNLIGAICGAVTYWGLYIFESVSKLMIGGSTFQAALAAAAPKMITSGINQTVAVIGSMILIIPLNRALKKYLPKFSSENSKRPEKE